MKERQRLKDIEFKEMAEAFLEGAGGCENIIGCYNCITRLRLKVKDQAAVDEEKIKTSGAAAVFWPEPDLVHIVIEPQVFDITRELKKLLKT